jgi:hypothetical protein
MVPGLPCKTRAEPEHILGARFDGGFGGFMTGGLGPGAAHFHLLHHPIRHCRHNPRTSCSRGTDYYPFQASSQKPAKTTKAHQPLHQRSAEGPDKEDRQAAHYRTAPAGRYCLAGCWRRRHSGSRSAGCWDRQPRSLQGRATATGPLRGSLLAEEEVVHSGRTGNHVLRLPGEAAVRHTSTSIYCTTS